MCCRRGLRDAARGLTADAQTQSADVVFSGPLVGRQDAGLSRHLAGTRHGLRRISKAILRKKASLPPGASSSIRPMGRFRTNRRPSHSGRRTIRKRATADPSIKCYQAGVPRATYLPTPLQILQSPGNFAIVYQDNHAFRVFHPDTRPHFDSADWWMGDTRYRWEGDTLVADVVALTDQLWLDQAGNFHSTEIHIVERYRMTGADTIEYEARIEDPVVYSKPWTLRTVLYRIKEPGARIIEDECLEDANGVRHHISPSDPGTC